MGNLIWYHIQNTSFIFKTHWKHPYEILISQRNNFQNIFKIPFKTLLTYTFNRDGLGIKNKECIKKERAMQKK